MNGDHAAIAGTVAASGKRPTRRRLPSAGFVALFAIYACVAAFFVWGLSTPPLDRVWTLHHELKSGRIAVPRERDRQVLAQSFARHPELASALLSDAEIGLISAHSEGWIALPAATVVRTSKAVERFLVLEVATPSSLLPFTVELRGEGWKQHVEVGKAGIRGIELPVLRSGSEAIVVKLRGHGLRADPSVLGVRITFAQAAPRIEGSS